MPTHHRVTLVVREEPEGHGTLFVEVERTPRVLAEQTAIALVRSQEMFEDRVSTDFIRSLRNVLSTNVEIIADRLADAQIQGTLEPIGQREVGEVMDSICIERSAVLMQFLAWMERAGYTVGDANGEVVEDQDLLNLFSGAGEVGVFSRAEILKGFAAWVDHHATWRMAKKHDVLVESRTVAAVEDYLKKMDELE